MVNKGGWVHEFDMADNAQCQQTIWKNAGYMWKTVKTVEAVVIITCKVVLLDVRCRLRFRESKIALAYLHMLILNYSQNGI